MMLPEFHQEAERKAIVVVTGCCCCCFLIEFNKWIKVSNTIRYIASYGMVDTRLQKWCWIAWCFWKSTCISLSRCCCSCCVCVRVCGCVSSYNSDGGFFGGKHWLSAISQKLMGSHALVDIFNLILSFHLKQSHIIAFSSAHSHS